MQKEKLHLQHIKVQGNKIKNSYMDELEWEKIKAY